MDPIKKQPEHRDLGGLTDQFIVTSQIIRIEDPEHQNNWLIVALHVETKSYLFCSFKPNHKKLLDCLESLKEIEKIHKDKKILIKIFGQPTHIVRFQNLLQNREIDYIQTYINPEAVFFNGTTGFFEIDESIILLQEPDKVIKVLIIDDSKTAAALLEKCLKESVHIEVLGKIYNPLEALEAIEKLKPDVITVDLNMPNLSGVQLIKKIMPKYPLPIVVISATTPQDGEMVFEAIAAGAVDYKEKLSFRPTLWEKQQLFEKIYAASKAKIFQNNQNLMKPENIHKPIKLKNSINQNLAQKQSTGIIAIGASTGGTEAIKKVLRKLPGTLPPIVIVQHIPPVFSTAFAKSLDDVCEINVKEAKAGDRLEVGHAYIAPGDFHMEISPGGSIFLNQNPPLVGHRPAVDILFNSISKLKNKKCIAILMTGMGSDGAKGLLRIKEAGFNTVSQSEKTCVVYGMPKSAEKLGASQKVLDIEDISEEIINFFK